MLSGPICESQIFSGLTVKFAGILPMLKVVKERVAVFNQLVKTFSARL